MSQYRISEGGESGDTQPSRAPSEVPSSHLSTERRNMKDQLHAIRDTINALAGTTASPAPMTRARVGKTSAASSVSGLPQPARELEKLLEDISHRLASIEGLYTDVSTKLVRVDHRTVENERTVRELQHISAGAINEQARLVDIMGSAGTPGIALPHSSTVTPPPRTRSRQLLPGSGGLPMASTATLELPGTPLASTINQHASHIHKLMAGLDFLEQHIIRQDQVIESVQKQLIGVAHDHALSGPGPNELAVRLHDASELLNKLRSHVYKLDKKTTSHDHGAQHLQSQLEQLAMRLEQLEQAQMQAGLINNPLFSSPEDSNSRGRAPNQGEVAALATAQSELRGAVVTFGHELHELIQRVQGMEASSTPSQPAAEAVAAATAAAAAAAAAEAAAAVAAGAVAPLRAEVFELRAQLRLLQEGAAAHDSQALTAVKSVADVQDNLASLQAAQQEFGRAAATTQTELAAMRQQLAAVVGSVEEQVASLASRLVPATTYSRSTSMSIPPSLVGADMAALLEKLQGSVEQLDGQLGQSTSELAGRCRVLEAAAKTHEPQLQALQAMVDELGAQRLSDIESHKAIKADVGELQGQLQQQVADLEGRLQQHLVDLAAAQAHSDAMVQGAHAALESKVEIGVQERQALMSKVEALEVLTATESQQNMQELVQLHTALKDTRQSVQTISDQVVDLASRLDTTLDDQLTAVKADANSAESKATSAQAQLALLQSQVTVTEQELGVLRRSVGEATSRLGDMATRVQAEGLAAEVEELQGSCQQLQGTCQDLQGSCTDAVAAVEQLRVQLTRDYINHEKLGAIFAAREDMRSALTKLEHVFTSGRVSPQATREVAQQLEAAGGSLALASGAAPELATQVQRLSQNVSQLQEQVLAIGGELDTGKETMESTRKRLEELGAQVSLALYRTEAMVRQEQLGGLQQGLVALEIQLKRAQLFGSAAAGAAASLPPRLAAAAAVASAPLAEEALAAIASAAAAAAVDDAMDSAVSVAGSSTRPTTEVGAVVLDDAVGRIRQLEQLVAELREFAVEAEPVVSEDVPELRRSVQDLQLMLFDLRSSQQLLAGGNATASLPGFAPPALRSPSASGAAATAALAAVMQHSGPHGLSRLSASADANAPEPTDAPSTAADGVIPTRDLSSIVYHSFAAPSGYASPPEAAGATSSQSATQQHLEQRLLQVEMSLSGKLGALEYASKISGTGDVSNVVASREEVVSLRKELHALSDQLQQLHSVQAAAAASPGEMAELRQELDRLSGLVAVLQRAPRSEQSTASGESTTTTLVLPLRIMDGTTELSLPVNIQLDAETNHQPPSNLATPRAQNSQMSAASAAFADHLGQVASRLADLETRVTSHSLDLMKLMDFGQAVTSLRVQLHNLHEGQNVVRVDCHQQKQRVDALQAGATAAAAQAATAATTAADAAAAAAAEVTAATAAAATAAQAANTAAAEVRAATAAAATAANAASSAAADATAATQAAATASAAASSAATEAAAASSAVAAVTAAHAPHAPVAADSVAPPPAHLAPVRTTLSVAGSFQSLAGLDLQPQTVQPCAQPLTAGSARSTFSGIPAVSPTGVMALGSAGATGAPVSGQTRFLHRLLEVVRKQSARLHSQYTDEIEVEGQLKEVDQTLLSVQHQLEDPIALSNGDAYAEAMVSILDQVAALRTIGSQTHPAIHQMLLSHDAQIQTLESRVGGEVVPRLTTIEGGLRRLNDSHAALNKAVHVLTSSAGVSLEPPGTPDMEEVAARGVPILAVDPTAVNALDAGSTAVLDAATVQNARVPSGDGSTSSLVVVSGGVGAAAAEGIVGQGGPDAAAYDALEARLVDYGRVLQQMRNRIVALQEYIDSTQGMVKELHTVHGSVLMRVAALEKATGGGGGGGLEGESVAQVQADLAALESRFLAFGATQTQLNLALEDLKQVGDRLAALDSRDTEVQEKLANIGQAMPTIAGQLRSLERTLQSRLDACCAELSALGSVLAEMGRMERPDSKNPFSGIGGAANAPAVKLLESKVELLRSALSNVARALAEEFKKQGTNT